MKKICYLIILTIGLFHACTPETDLLFEKPASERMSETLQNYQDLLVSDSHGWLVEYYPHSSQSYGGFNLFFQFTEKEVTVRSEVVSPILKVEEATSTYSLGEDMGPTLNFDTYNEVFNFFSDPALPVGGGAGYGLEGDYEFIFMSGDANEIILRGKKTKNTIRLTPMTFENWGKYREDIIKMTEAIGAPAYKMTVNGVEFTIKRPSSDYNRFAITYQEDEKTVTTDLSFRVTPMGIYSYEPLTIHGVTMQEFTYNATTDQIVSADGKVVISLIFPPVEEIFRNSLTTAQWFFSSTAMGSGFTTAFNAMKSGITISEGEQLRYAWIGLSVESSKSSFSFGSQASPTVTYFGSILLNFTKVAEERIKIEVTTQTERDGNYYMGVVPTFKAFVNSLGGEYNVTTTDPLRKVSSVTLTSPEDPNRTFTLTREVVEFP